MGPAAQGWKLSWVAWLLALMGIVGAPAVRAQTNEWTWMGGSQTGDQNPVPGTEGVPAATNFPGPRSDAAVWVDSNGITWVFSGSRYLFDASSGIWVNTVGSPNDLWQFDQSTDEWVWVAGSFLVDHQAPCTQCQPPAVYGTLGVAAPGNIPGGRSPAATWTDTQGNFWMFGGSDLNDLWEFSPTSMEWTWRGGSSPGVGYMAPSGIYGTRGQFAVTNSPGSRIWSVGWTDANGNLWLFGGSGLDAHGQWVYLNDLWEFDPVKGEWAWMSGASYAPYDVGSGAGEPAVYGTLGNPDSNNTPGGRELAAGWVDRTGNLWLFGGQGCDGSGTVVQGCVGDAFLNDLWKFDMTAKAWAWMGGPNIAPCSLFFCGQAGQYGTLGVEDPTNIPGGRFASTAWTGSDGNFWLFGGIGLDSGRVDGNLNDLWVFDMSDEQWKWMGGYSFTSSNCYSGQGEPTYCGAISSSYGTLGVPDPADYPGGRGQALGWTGPDGSLWLYGGGISNEFNVLPDLGDLWRFVPEDSALPPAITPLLSAPSGTYLAGGPLTIANGMPNSSIYYTNDGSTPSVSSSPYTGPIQITTSTTVKAIALAEGYPDSGIASATYVILPPASEPSFSVSSGTYTSVQRVSLSDPTAGVSIYYTTDGSTPTTYSANYSLPITVSSTETINAIAAGNGYGLSPVASATYTINLPPSFALSLTPSSVTTGYGAAATVEIGVAPQNGFNSAVSFACSGLPVGAMCAFSPTTVTPSGGAATTTLTVTAPATSSAVRPFGLSLLPASSLALVVGIFGWNRRRNTFAWLLVLAACAGLGMMTACGGGGSSSGGGGGGSKTITATVTVTAASGSLQQTASFNLTVN